MGITDTLNIEANFKRASVLLTEGNQLAAIQIYKKLLTQKEAERNATIKLADLYDQSGNTKSAIELFDSYLKKNSSDEEVIKLVSYYLVRNSLFDEASKFISKYENVKDENMDFLKGVVNFHINNLENSIKIFNEFLKDYNSSELLPSVLFYVSKIYLRNNQIENALKAIKNSIELSPNNAETYKIEAEIYFRKEMYYHANESIRRALKLNPSVIAWRHFQIKIFVLLDEIHKAEEKLSNAMDNSDSSAEILHLIGNWHLRNKDVPIANRYFEKAKGINPNISKIK
ncbi:MAG: tetratricopeptide repeat protein [Melioribacteraceae bacterium]|nr:tetratricopeptide repeat protein [Melioribacteraceae bacterium]